MVFGVVHRSIKGGGERASEVLRGYLTPCTVALAYSDFELNEYFITKNVVSRQWSLCYSLSNLYLVIKRGSRKFLKTCPIQRGPSRLWTESRALLKLCVPRFAILHLRLRKLSIYSFPFSPYAFEKKNFLVHGQNRT